ncbi:hypothetical protein [Microbacterium sp.]|uniref:hypothetical protein n=1 Tax=Microbacterium sp. TaxID=51671 RepID=UPI003F6E785C
MTSRIPRLGAALVLAATAFLVTACSSAAPEPTPTTTTASSPTPTEPAPEATETEAPIAEDATCENIILEQTVADFASVGWTSQASRFYLGDLEIADGIQCVWADFEGPAGDHLQLFGWAPVSDEDAATAQESLIAQGWIREDAPEGIYITENPDTTIATDENGYGMTYLFTPGNVKLADTKQGILLIDWPKG